MTLLAVVALLAGWSLAAVVVGLGLSKAIRRLDPPYLPVDREPVTPATDVVLPAQRVSHEQVEPTGDAQLAGAGSTAGAPGTTAHA